MTVADTFAGDELPAKRYYPYVDDSPRLVPSSTPQTDRPFVLRSPCSFSLSKVVCARSCPFTFSPSKLEFARSCPFTFLCKHGWFIAVFRYARSLKEKLEIASGEH